MSGSSSMQTFFDEQTSKINVAIGGYVY